MTTKLKECPNPWCAGDHEVDVSLNVAIGARRFFHIACDACGIEGPTYTTEAEAITAWNTRSPDMDGVEGRLAAIEAGSLLLREAIDETRQAFSRPTDEAEGLLASAHESFVLIAATSEDVDIANVANIEAGKIDAHLSGNAAQGDCPVCDDCAGVGTVGAGGANVCRTCGGSGNAAQGDDRWKHCEAMACQALQECRMGKCEAPAAQADTDKAALVAELLEWPATLGQGDAFSATHVSGLMKRAAAALSSKDGA